MQGKQPQYRLVDWNVNVEGLLLQIKPRFLLEDVLKIQPSLPLCPFVQGDPLELGLAHVVGFGQLKRILVRLQRRVAPFVPAADVVQGFQHGLV